MTLSVLFDEWFISDCTNITCLSWSPDRCVCYDLCYNIDWVRSLWTKFLGHTTLNGLLLFFLLILHLLLLFLLLLILLSLFLLTSLLLQILAFLPWDLSPVTAVSHAPYTTWNGLMTNTHLVYGTKICDFQSGSCSSKLCGEILSSALDFSRSI